jgi:hypothetical protein
MRALSLSRRNFLSQSSALATVWATAPRVTDAAALFGQRSPDNLPGKAVDSKPQHVVVPLYRGGKFIQVVSGDPRQAGAPYVLRIANSDGQVVFPHRHPEDEHITVVQGTWYLGSGETFDRNVLEEMSIGTYGMVPRGMPHFAWSRGETIIQVHGTGPFRVDFLEPPIFLSDPQEPTKYRVDPSQFKYKLGQRVLSEKGPGIISFGHTTAKHTLVQYEIKRDDGGLFCALEENLSVPPAP